MYTELSATRPACIFLVQTIERQNIAGLDRKAAVAMGIGMGLARSLPRFAATSTGDVAANYTQNHEMDVRNYAGAINELTPIDARMVQMYTFKFYQLVQGIGFQAINGFDAATAVSVAHSLLGTEMFFSPEDIVFMEKYKEAVLKIAAATALIVVAS